MADINASAVGNPIVEARDQITLIAAVDVAALQAININSGGQWQLAGANAAGKFTAVHIAGKTVKAGQPLTGVRSAVLDGYDLTGMAINDPIYLSDTLGALGTTAGTNSLTVGRVVPANGHVQGGTQNKLAKIASPL